MQEQPVDLQKESVFAQVRDDVVVPDLLEKRASLCHIHTSRRI
jgi:hypothetical protein